MLGKKVKMENYPLSAMFEGMRTASTGAFTFVLGVVGGTVLALFITIPSSYGWYWYPMIIFFVVPYTIVKLWGLLLLPLYGIVFYGLVWLEWSRVLCFTILAMATSIVILISFGDNLFAESEIAWRFLIAESVLATTLVISVLVERARNCPTST